MKLTLSSRLLALLLITLPGAALAQAQNQSAPDLLHVAHTVEDASPTAPQAAVDSAAVADTSPNPFGAAAIGDSMLQSVAGRQDVTQVTQANLAAGVSRNSVGDNSETGDARIDGNAFQNMSGLSILNVNTGNNVAINAAMNVNIQINQGP